MANNIDFITSIRIESDFEEIVRRIVKHIYDAEAYLIGGPYDGGRDLIYKNRGKEVKEAVQITIQRTKIEEKLLHEANNVLKLVSEHSYPSRLIFFWSQTMSASKKLSHKKMVRDATGVELEIYDATELEQIITNDEPSIFEYLLSVIHKVNYVTPPIDAKARAFYDYLTLGKDAVNLKTSTIDAQIVSALLQGSHMRTQLMAELENIGIKAGVANGRIAALKGKNRILDDGAIVSLSHNEALRIENILRKDEADKAELLTVLKDVSEVEAGIDLSHEAFELIKEAYRASVEVQISEITFESPKLTKAKEIVRKLEALILSKGAKNEKEAKTIAKKLIEAGAQNEYFSNQCSSLLCLNLFNQSRLERYIRERSFFIYLDATVFIRYLALFHFKTREAYDREMTATANLRDSMKGLGNSRIRITREHLEETLRHITQAEKISKFANDKLIQKFGESKNVYYNLYLAEKGRKKQYSFADFLKDLIGYENSGTRVGSAFDEYLSCVQRFLKLAGIEIAEYYGDALEVDPIARKIVTRYEYWAAQIGKQRKHRAALNDLSASYIFSDDSRHRDAKGVGHVPMFITWDSTQHHLRDLFRAEFPHAEWLVYSPQRAIERFSMLDFSMNSKIIKDNVLVILDEDYIKDSSLIDTLAIFLNDNMIESDAIISVLTRLSGRLHSETGDAAHFELEEKNLISDALISLQYEFNSRFASLKKLFSDELSESKIVDILSRYISGDLNKDALLKAFDEMLAVAVSNSKSAM
jgi:hypothetical protein